MRRTPESRQGRRTRRLAGLFLKAFPRRFREQYGDDMLEFLEQSWAERKGAERARAVARSLIGVSVQGLRERARSMRLALEGMGWMGHVARDFRFAVRALRRRPGFTLAAVVTLALAIGAASAVFTVVDAVVLRPLPYPDQDRLVALWTEFDNQGDARFGLSFAELYDLARETRAFDAIGGFSPSRATLTGLGDAAQVPVVFTQEDFFEVTGIGARLGRLPAADDVLEGAPPVALLSHEFWTSAFAADPSVVGRTVDVDAVPVEIIGVLEPGARLPFGTASLWRPVARDRASVQDRSGHGLDVIARLSDDSTPAAAAAELRDVEDRWRAVYSGQHSPGLDGHRFELEPVHQRYFGTLKSSAYLLLGAVLLVLALACANVASLLLARGQVRAEELAVRNALGAGRGRLTAQLLIEAGVLAAASGATGLAMAALATDGLMSLAPDGIPRVDMVAVDARVATFAVIVSAIAGLAFGTVPALRSSNPDRLRGARRTGPDRALSRSLSALVVAQLALGVVLLTGSSLLMRSLAAVADADPGLSAEGRLTATLSLPSAVYPDLADITDFWDRALRGAEAIPGVERAALTRQLPIRDVLRREQMTLVPRAAAGPEDVLSIAYQLVSPSFFETLDVPIVDGRALDAGDGEGAPLVAVVNEAAARAYWDGANPLGRTVDPLFTFEDRGLVTIVGVAGDVLSEGVRGRPGPELYLPYAQTPDRGRSYARTGTLVLRTSGEPLALVDPLRALVRDLDSALPLTRVATYEEVLATARAQERFLATVLSVFALIALVIAAGGTYGVVAYAVAQRTREFGLRMAMGADRPRILRTVLRGGAAMVTWGVAIGVVASLAAGPVVTRFLFGVGAAEPASLILGPLVMTVVVVVASARPALRASGVSPAVTLRSEG